MKTDNHELATLIQNTSINISLSGWPAALSVIAVCAAGVTVCALYVTHPATNSEPISTSRPYVA